MKTSDPREKRRCGPLRVGVLPTSSGLALLALSPRGVVALFFGDDAGALQREFKRRFCYAEISEPDENFKRVAESLLEVVEGASPSRPITLDLRGTPFQRRVWRALIGIPAGTTISYRDLARTIGSPGASRAVAGACAANPVAIIVPCHRVVRADGELSGYRWGAARKVMLLARERSTPAGASSCTPVLVWPE